MRTLLIDNYDSFTYNLFQLLAEVNGEEPVVLRNDEAGWEGISRLDFDNVVISPGPGRPERARDFGVCAELIRRCEAPLLGVCLGHQGLGWVQGGAVVAAEPMHGKVSTVSHDGCSPLFEGIPRRFKAVRYHSLCLAAPLPKELEPIAWAEDGVVMGIAHSGRSHWGVQFHPESVATEHGRRLLANFRDLSAQRLPTRPGGGAFVTQGGTKTPRDARNASEERIATPRLELLTRRLGFAVDPEAAFGALYADSEAAFWLDSGQPGPQARFSFLGDASGPLAATVSYDVETGEVMVERDGKLEVGRGPLLDHLDRELRRLRPLAPELPFGFDCGFVGYLGYELKAECGADRAHRSELPDAALVFADRLVAVDHDEGDTHLLCLARPDEAAEAERWLAATASALASLDPGRNECEKRGGGPRAEDAPNGTASPVEPRLARSRARYLEDIGECKARLIEGESYEICLTNSLSAEFDVDPLDLYRELRRVNPSPFSAYLRFGDLTVLSSSPERFLEVDRGRRVEARPIKGTSRRGTTPEEDARLAAQLGGDPKSRAENLMIVDLLRNDLGSVSETGSVEVTALMEVETYETVHHLVSAIRARLRAGATATDCVQACFPPGSMTGAPKRRTMEILDRIEGRPRGPYSGAIGYFGLGGGCDLSVAIRTIVVAGRDAAIGAGGAIVTESDPQREYDEMVLKAEAPMMAIEASRRRSLPAGAGRV